MSISLLVRTSLSSLRLRNSSISSLSMSSLPIPKGIEITAMLAWVRRNGWTLKFGAPSMYALKFLSPVDVVIEYSALNNYNQVSIYNMDWSHPTAIVVGNENRGISDDALELSDLHCSIPMKGMVDSFNVSVAAGILMHHAVCDRTSRLGCYGDLTSEERKILVAEFSLHHSKSALSIAHEYAKRKAVMCTPKL